MGFVFNFEVISNEACVNQFGGYLQQSNGIEEETAVNLVNRMCEADVWDYVNAVCFKLMKDGTKKQQRTVRFNNPSKSLKVTVTDQVNAPMWHANFVNAVCTWQRITSATPNNKTVVQQFIDGENLNLSVKVCEKIVNGFSLFVFVYQWKSFEDKTLFTLKY